MQVIMSLYWIDFLFIMLDYLLYTLLFSYYMKKKAWVSVKSISAVIFLVSMVDFLSGLLQVHLLSVLISGLLLLLLNSLLFEGNLRLKCVLVSLCLLFSFILEMGSGFFWSMFFGIEAVSLIDHKEHMLLATAFFLALKIILILILPWFFEKHGIEKISSGFQIKMALVPLFSLLGIFVLGYQFLVKEEPDYLAVITVGMIIGFINILYFIVLRLHMKLYRENMANQVAAKEYEMREEYYQTLDRHQKEIRTIKHDLKNQILTIAGVMDEHGSQKAREQLDLIMGDLQQQDQMHFTVHKGLNILLAAKYRRAEADQISCDFDIRIPESVPIEEKDLGALIGNILDNAIEGCQRCLPENRYIRLKTVYFKNSLVIQCENPTDGQVSNLRTRKNDCKNHGLGTESIQHIAEQYNGNLDYEIVKDLFRLNITLWFK